LTRASAHRDVRANQKERTRAAIVEAAARLLREGAEPTVATAAEAAKVSRATAYRYFPTPESLNVEVASVTPTYAAMEDLVASLEGDDIEARLLKVLATFNATSFDDEARLRMALKVYLDTWFANRALGDKAPAVREGRRMRWLEHVLAPVRGRLTKAQLRKLEAALALTVGVDALVVMKDVCRLNEKEAQDVLLWAAQALLRAGLDEAAAKPRRAKGKSRT